MEEQVKEQEVEQVKEPAKRVVTETTYKPDQRLNYFAGTVVQAVDKFISDYNAQQKIQGKQIEFEAETNTFVAELKEAVKKYASNFAQTKDVEVVEADIENEFNELTTRLQSLEQDPDIKYLEAKKEFQVIRERQLKLKSYYDQIIAQKTKEKVE